MTLYEKYIKDVSGGKKLVCEFVKNAVERHLNDLKKSKEKDYPYFFDPDAADHVITFVKVLRHTDGEYYGEKFNLQPFQAFLLAMIFGWKKKKNDKRRFRKAYISMPRKNGKSEFAAAVGLYGLLKDGENGAEIYPFANSRDQAKVVFSIMEKMMTQLLEESASARKLVKMNYNNINVVKYARKAEPLASDSKKLDGRRPHFGIADEVHEMKDFTLLKVVETGMSRLQPLLLMITTAGFNRYGPCYNFRKVMVSLLRGIMENDNVFACIWTIDEGDDWEEEKTWEKANPNIGNSPYWDFLREMYKMAVTEGSHAEIEFKTKNLNIWTTTSATYIKDSDWLASDRKFNPEELLGERCWGGLDCSRVEDITARCLLFPFEEEGEIHYNILMKYWIPLDAIDARSSRDGVPYRDWYDEGRLEAIPGRHIDDDWLFEDLLDCNSKYKLTTLEYDPRFAHKLINRLDEEGVMVSKFIQSSTHFTSPITDLKRNVINKKFHFNEDPILRWMASNVLLKRWAGGGLMIDKEKSMERVDGVVALLMAYGGYQTDEDEYGKKSVYENRGVKSFNI